MVREPAATSLRGVVDLVERLGAETLAHVSLVIQRQLITIVARMPEGTTLTEGDAVSLDAQLKRLTLFDAEGRRIEAG
jgi:ABC-type sugar transport system ATPase subunit